MPNQPMKSRINLKSLFVIFLLAAGLFGTSCSNSLQSKGDLSFTISKPVLNSIAARAVDEVSDKDLALVNIEISLFDAENNKNIGKDSKSLSLKELVDNPQAQDFTFKKIEIGRIVYAKALVTVTYEGETKELCSGESDKVTVEAANSTLTIKLSINKKDRAYYLNEALSFDITIKNNSVEAENLIPEFSLFVIDPALAGNDVTGTPYLQSPKTFIRIMDDPMAFLGTFTGSKDSNDNINIKAQINQKQNFKLDSEVCLLAVANYDNDKTGILSFIDIKTLTLAMENTLDFDLQMKEIPAKLEFYKSTTSSNTEYTQMSEVAYSSFRNYFTSLPETELISRFNDEINNSCPEGYTFETKIESSFNSNYITVKIYYDKIQYYGNGTIDVTITDPNTNLLTITATPSEKFSMNSGSISLGAIRKEDNTDLSDSNDVTWTAQLLYGGTDINEYYEVKKDDSSNKTSVVLINKLLVAGWYQLYVTATYQNMTTSQMFDIEVSDYGYYEYDVSDSDFDSQFASDVLNMTNNATIVFAGTTNSTQFQNILQNLSKVKAQLEVDLSDLEGITEISYGSKFYAENLKTIKLPASLTKLPKNAFQGDSKLTSITIPTTISEIEGGAFNGCTSLESITFKGEPSVPSFIYENGAVIKIEEDMLTGASTKTMVAAIPNIGTSINFNDFPEVTIIGKEVFNDWESLVAVDLSGIEEVGDSAFYGCSGLTSITNYESLQTVGVAGFRNCKISKFTINENMTLETNAFASAIDELTIDIEITAENAADIRDRFITPTYGAKHVIFNKPVVIPDLTSSSFTLCQSAQNPKPNPPASTIKLQDAYLYSYKTKLESIEFKGENSSIGKNQFINYTKLTQIITNGNVTSIGDFAFYGCSGLESVDLQGVTYVGTCAFENCTALADLTIGNTVTQIGQRAFYKANGLSGKTFVIPVSAFALGASSFYVASGSQPAITITQASSPQTENWYSVEWPKSTDNYWTKNVMDPLVVECPSIADGTANVSKIEGNDISGLYSTITSAMTSQSADDGTANTLSYLRAIGSGN